jgi:hypothetical protein
VTHRVAPQGRKNLLNTRIPKFTIPQETTLHNASLQLLLHLYFVLHTNSTGIAGDYPGGNANCRVGPLNIRNATIRQILDRIIS